MPGKALDYQYDQYEYEDFHDSDGGRILFTLLAGYEANQPYNRRTCGNVDNPHVAEVNFGAPGINAGHNVPGLAKVHQDEGEHYRPQHKFQGFDQFPIPKTGSPITSSTHDISPFLCASTN